MSMHPTLVLGALLTIAVGAVHAQSTASSPAGQNAPAMANMPGMSGTSSADMNTQMKQCAQINAQMKAGIRMTPDMKPMMDRCNKMDRGMAAKAPDDTLSR